MTKLKAQIVSISILILFAAGIFISLPLHAATAYAASTDVAFDETYIMDDLQSATTVGDTLFEPKNYPYKEDGVLQVLTVVEYAYSHLANQRGNFGLYIYIYNPKGLPVSANSVQNKVLLADKYNATGAPTDYSKYKLKLCSKSTGAYDNLYYKYKVIDEPGKDGKTIAERVNTVSRRYDIAEIELLMEGAHTATSVFTKNADQESKKSNRGLTATFTGYARGYGPDPNGESTLKGSFADLETIELNVTHTYYRTDMSRDKYTQGQLNSVYFGVSNDFFEQYDYLQRIKAEWYEYMTRPIIVTKNKGFLDAARPKIGTAEKPGELGLVLDYVFSPEPYDVGYWSYNTGTYIANADAFALLSMPDSPTIGFPSGLIPLMAKAADPILYYLFDVEQIEYTDPASTATALGGVSGERLTEWIYDYDKSFVKGKLENKTAPVSADLFYDHIMPERIKKTDAGEIKRGYSYFDFDIKEDLINLPSYNQRGERSFHEKVRDFGIWDAIFNTNTTGNQFNDGYYDIPPIYIVTDEDLKLSDAELSRSLFIRSEDVAKFRADYEAAKQRKEKTVLFRFADTEYFSAMVDICKPPNFLGYVDRVQNEAYVAVETVFLDFDILQLTFNKDGNLFVIPVAMSPIDIVPDLTTPLVPRDDSAASWWKWLLWGIIAVVGVILLVIFSPVIIKLLSALINGMIWLVKLPARAIRKVKGNKKKAMPPGGSLPKAKKRKRPQPAKKPQRKKTKRKKR